MKKLNLLAAFSKLQLDNKKILLVIIGCLFIIYLDYAFVIRLQFKAIKDLNPKITKLKKDLSELSSKLGGVQDLKTSQIAASQKLFAKTKKIIFEAEIPSLLQLVSELANKNDVKITQMKPVKELPGKQDKSSQKVKFTPLLVSLELTCDYHDLGYFINALENAQTFIAVQEMKILSGEKDYLKQKVILVLRTYVKK
jgi:Tfp pilus assembly protein PilO